MIPPRHEGSEPLFRRRRFVAPRRRRRLITRLARPFVGALAIVLVPALVVWWVRASPALRVSELAVSSTVRVDGRWVESRLEPLRGRHVLSIRLGQVERLLADHPWIASVEMRKELPGRLEIEVRERRPVAVLDSGSGRAYLDAAGRVIAEAPAGWEPAELVVVEATDQGPETLERAVRAAARWSRLRPGEKISRVEISSPSAFRLHSDSLPFAVLVAGDDFDLPASKLDSVARFIARSHPVAETVDLRFRRQIVFQMAVQPPTREG